MDLNNTTFLNFLYTKQINREGLNAQVSNSLTSDTTEANINTLSSDSVTLNGKNVDLTSVISDEALEKINKETLNKNNRVYEASSKTGITGLSEAEKKYIKTLIYKLHHPEASGTDTDGTSTSGTGTDGTSGTGTSGSGSSTTNIPKIANIKEMFTYASEKDASITETTGFTKAQLLSLASDDAVEAANGNLFGLLYRAFDTETFTSTGTSVSGINRDTNDIISEDEIKAFIGNETIDTTSLAQQVEAYSDELQAQYTDSKMTGQDKLNFALEKTEEYLTAAGLTDQLAALKRLTNETDDTHSEIHKGQISFKDLNPTKNSKTTTLGEYEAWKNKSNGSWGGDTDDDSLDFDGGIVLDLDTYITSTSTKWYELVDTLVHELTHATAYQYYTDPDSGVITSKALTELLNKGGITQAQYDTYSKESLATLSKDSAFIDKINVCWKEYFAYKTDEDYLDGIGLSETEAKEINVDYHGTTPATEASEIATHINSFYKGQTKPWDNWYLYA